MSNPKTTAGGMTFKSYINQRRNTRGSAGDFVRDAKNDDTFPDQMVSWQDIKSYLVSQRAIPDAIKAGHQVWVSYARCAYVGTKRLSSN